MIAGRRYVVRSIVVRIVEHRQEREPRPIAGLVRACSAPDPAVIEINAHAAAELVRAEGAAGELGTATEIPRVTRPSDVAAGPEREDDERDGEAGARLQDT